MFLIIAFSPPAILPSNLIGNLTSTYPSWKKIPQFGLHFKKGDNQHFSTIFTGKSQTLSNQQNGNVNNTDEDEGWQDVAHIQAEDTGDLRLVLNKN